jgi:hypothetical protein
MSHVAKPFSDPVVAVVLPETFEVPASTLKLGVPRFAELLPSPLAADRIVFVILLLPQISHHIGWVIFPL